MTSLAFSLPPFSATDMSRGLSRRSGSLQVPLFLLTHFLIVFHLRLQPVSILPGVFSTFSTKFKHRNPHLPFKGPPGHASFAWDRGCKVQCPEDAAHFPEDDGQLGWIFSLYTSTNIVFFFLISALFLVFFSSELSVGLPVLLNARRLWERQWELARLVWADSWFPFPKMVTAGSERFLHRHAESYSPVIG